MVDWLARLAAQDRLLTIVGIATALLFAIALLFALLTIALRLRSLRLATVRTRLEQTWEPLVLGALTGDVSPEAVRNAVAPRDSLFFVAYVLRFVNRFVGEERNTMRQLTRPYLPLVAAQLKSRSAESRAHAVQTLVLVGMEEYDREVLSALDDPSLTVAMVAARTLASKEQTRFAPEILGRIHRFEHWNPLYLASLFSGMGSDVVPALRQIYQDPSSDRRVRRVVADALHDLDDIESAATAHTIALAEEDVELLAASMRLLARVGGPADSGVARRALGHDSALVRLRAADALGELGGPQDLLRLRAAIDDPEPWVSLAAARALSRLGGRDILESLCQEETPRGSLAREILSAGAGPA